MQGRVKRPLFDEKRVVRCGLDPLGHGVSMPGTPAQSLENEELEAPAQDIQIGFGHGFPLSVKGTVSAFPLLHKGSTPACSRARLNQAW